MTTFCAEHDITRKTFYAIRNRARTEGQAAALEPRSRRPRTSPGKITVEAERQAIEVRAALESSGLDHGPISVHDKMRSLGLTAPSVASLARIFRQAGVARKEPRKKPRSSYRRFVYPAPNACWQLDATEYVLAGGRKCVIFQLEDDHSRLAVASHVAAGETSTAAVTVFKKGVTARGVPQRLLTDNGAALSPARRGWEGQLTAYATRLGVEAITGKPYKPTTQGKNERFHQTLFRFLDEQPLAETIEQLQEQVDRFDHIYNTERPHQGLPGRITPQQAWDAIPVAEPPRPKQAAPESIILDPAPGAPGTELDGLRPRRVKSNGAIDIKGVTYQIARELAGETVYIATPVEGVWIYDHTGTLLLTHPWPGPGVKHVSNGRPRGSGARRPENIVDVLRPARARRDGEFEATVRIDGKVSIRNVAYQISRRLAGERLHVIIANRRISFYAITTGELLLEHDLPAPDIRYVPNGLGRGTQITPNNYLPDTPRNPEVSPMS